MYYANYSGRHQNYEESTAIKVIIREKSSKTKRSATVNNGKYVVIDNVGINHHAEFSVNPTVVIFLLH